MLIIAREKKTANKLCFLYYSRKRGRQKFIVIFEHSNYAIAFKGFFATSLGFSHFFLPWSNRMRDLNISTTSKIPEVTRKPLIHCRIKYYFLALNVILFPRRKQKMYFTF